MAKTYEKYGKRWDNSVHPLQVEMFCISQGAKWCEEQGRNLSYHFEQFRRICWPELDGEHNGQRWHKLCRDELVKNKVTVLMGAGSSGKTHEPSWVFLVDYWCFPEETCVLVSSTQVTQLKKRVWAEMTDLWQKGVDRFPFLAGHLLDSAIAITTDPSPKDLDYGDRKIRDMRKGIFGIACVQGGKFVGLNRYVGIKQKRMRIIADEAQFMGEAFLSAFANLNKNPDFKAAILGNPNDILDQLGRAAEPKEGWTEDYLDSDVTRVWDTRFMNGRCVNLVGLDSPNFDFPQDQPPRFTYLISAQTINETLSFFKKDSHEYYSQCKGTMKIGTVAQRVLTRSMAIKNRSLEQVKWKDGKTIKIYFVDSSYGGDNCVGGSAEFGEDVDGVNVLAFGEPKIIPIVLKSDVEPEYQIANFVKQDCEEQGIHPSHMGHDSTGRGGLGTAIAKVWSADTHPVEFGGAATDRPISLDEYTVDEETKRRRLVRCNERFDRFVTELWFMVRYASEASQLRNLPEECLSDLSTRRWYNVRNDVKSVEPKNKTSNDPAKQGMKQRTGKSPDHGDWASGIVEMARRAGFKIAKLAANAPKNDKKKTDWVNQAAEAARAAITSRQLQEA